MKNSILVLSILITNSMFAQLPKKLETHKIYSKSGKELNFDKWIKELSKSDVVLFGELHNNAIIHWLQLEVIMSLNSIENKQVAVGAEMFERDAQIVIDEYMNGLIKLSHLENEGKAWNNLKTDYLPVLDFCKENGIPYYATNIPRRYASLVATKGLEGLQLLNEEAKVLFYSQAFEFPLKEAGYEGMSAMMGNHGHGNPMNFINAQAIKDITMAETIYLKKRENEIFVHLNGDFHSKEYGGIYFFLKRFNPSLKITTISVIESSDLLFEEHYAGLGDFVIVVNERVTKTY